MQKRHAYTLSSREVFLVCVGTPTLKGTVRKVIKVMMQEYIDDKTTTSCVYLPTGKMCATIMWKYGKFTATYFTELASAL